VNAPAQALHSLVDTGEAVIAPTYTRPDVLFTHGSGCWLYAEDGTPYLDMTTGIAVTSLGHDNDVVKGALQEAANGLIHTSNLFHTAPGILLAKALTDHSFAASVFFCNSGAEAVEGAIKFARLATGRHGILYFGHSFHGRTFGALAATDKPPIKEPFAPLPTGFSRAPFNDDAALEHITDALAAVIVEPIQGEGGVRPADPAWLAAVRARCDEAGVLLICDEIQCGLARSGDLWAHEESGIAPDIMTLAKPLAGGLPMGAILLGERVAPHVTPSCHGSTFGGGPVVSSVALAVFEALSAPSFLLGVRERSRVLRDALTEGLGDHLVALRGRGLMLGVKVGLPPKDVMAACFDAGLLVVPAGDDVIRFLPPLNASVDDLELAARRFSDVVSTLHDARESSR
jgi:acetylornithine/succinyldiaminopimelate/putrescine aminotransferase